MNAIMHKRKPVAALVSLLLALPATALAQDEFTLDEPTKPEPDPEKVAELTEIRNTVEVGIAYVTDASFRFGRYTGLEDDGLYGVMNLDYTRRGPYDGDDATWSALRFYDLGLNSREAEAAFGKQGSFGLRIRYDQIPSYRLDTASTPLAGAGTGQLAAPAGWVGATSTAGMTQLLPSLGSVPIQVERERTGLEFEKQLGRRWTFLTDFRVEERAGLKTLGAVIGNSGGNPRAVILPEPVDYQTREFEAAARYAGPRAQFQFSYHLSLFENERTTLAWQNPYTAIAGWIAAAGYPTGFGQMGQPPDNDYHQWSAAAGFDFSERTRLTLEAVLGRMTQDEPFLPYTVNPAAAASITQPLPRDSLEGRIETLLFDVALSSRIDARFHWSAGLRVDDRDNETPRDEFVYIGGDSTLQDTTVASSRRRFNEPHSFDERRVYAQGAYRFGSGGQLSASVERRDTDRTFTEREEAEEDRIYVGLSRDFGGWLAAALRWRQSDRKGSTYFGEEPFLSGYSPGYTSTVAGGWENPPGLRKFHLADRDREQLGAQISITPPGDWAFNLEFDRSDDDYRQSELGLTASEIETASIDVSWSPSEAWSVYAFYTRDDLFSTQDGVSIRGATRVADAVDPARAWNARHDDQVETAGAGLTFRPDGGRFEFGLDASFMKSESDVAVTTGSGLTSAPLPTITADGYTAGVTAAWKLSKSTTLRARYWFEDYESEDWALDWVEANQLANVILLGEVSPDYRVHVILLSMQIRL
ncbi:MAG: MtrB/PioB family decaheme-associated outer membrane protein [Gammaproteobacteria bacterium]